jgi:hypothetical protein
VTGYEDNLACVEVCNSFPKWGGRDQKRKFVFADNKIILMKQDVLGRDCQRGGGDRPGVEGRTIHEEGI